MFYMTIRSTYSHIRSQVCNAILCHPQRNHILYSCNFHHNSSFMDEARKKLEPLGEGCVHLTLEEDVGLARICLDNQPKKNAISGRILVQLEEAVNQLEKWEKGKALILEGAGDLFCSGGDLISLPKTPYFGSLLFNYTSNLLLRIQMLPLVSVCLVHGKAIAGGAELTAATDYRIFTKTGEACFVQANMGISSAFGGAAWLSNILGKRKALDILLTCKKLNAEEAFRIGYADAVAPEVDSRKEFAREWILQKTSHELEVVRSLKHSVFESQRDQLEKSLTNEHLVFSKLWGGPAHLKAVSSKKNQLKISS